MFKLHTAHQKMPEVVNCYTFGATLHVVGSKDFNADKVTAQLASEGIAGAKIYPAKGDIEDLFIKLMESNANE